MASDRGTLSRAGGPGAGHPTSAAPTVPGGRQLPGAPRERRPALAALAILLIIGGGLAAAALVLATSKRLTGIEITQPVTQGQQIPLTAMQPVQVASGTGVQYALWTQRFAVAKTFAATTIPAGTVMTAGMAAQNGTSLHNKVLVGLALKAGQLPSSLSQGQTVAIYAVSSSGGGSTGCPQTAGTVLAGNAVVQAVGGESSASGTGTTNVTVAVDPNDAGKVSCSASGNGVAIAVEPGGASEAPAPSGSQPGTAPSAPYAGSTAGAGATQGAQPSPPVKRPKATPAPTGTG